MKDARWTNRVLWGILLKVCWKEVGPSPKAESFHHPKHFPESTNFPSTQNNTKENKPSNNNDLTTKIKFFLKRRTLSYLIMLEIYKCINGACPSFMLEFFKPKDANYNLRTNNLLQLPKTNTLVYGNNSLSFRGSILWNTLSDIIKIAQNTKQFKVMIKSWKGDKCNCNICWWCI